jgi:hypothetical protein
MNAINQIYAPLATTKSPVYKERLVILCDRCHITKEDDYNKFIAGYKLEENTDIFILPV